LKHETISKYKNTKFKNGFRHFDLENLNLFRISYFDIRIYAYCGGGRKGNTEVAMSAAAAIPTTM